MQNVKTKKICLKNMAFMQMTRNCLNSLIHFLYLHSLHSLDFSYERDFPHRIIAEKNKTENKSIN